MEMLHDAANRGTLSSVEAQTAISLFLRREAKYQEAIQVIRKLKNQYPRNYLFCLEDANLRKDAGNGMAAAAAYREILSANAKRGYFTSAQLELTYFGLGEALRGQRHYGEAARAYEQAASSTSVGPELKVRSLLAAGQCHDLSGDRQKAIKDYNAAIDAGPRTSRASIARKLLHSAYRGT
jgi:tetratricopeptide (TPR) repeat protein